MGREAEASTFMRMCVFSRAISDIFTKNSNGLLLIANIYYAESPTQLNSQYPLNNGHTVHSKSTGKT